MSERWSGFVATHEQSEEIEYEKQSRTRARLAVFALITELLFHALYERRLVTRRRVQTLAFTLFPDAKVIPERLWKRVVDHTVLVRALCGDTSCAGAPHPGRCFLEAALLARL